MENIKTKIITAFENKNKNFKKRLEIEFIKEPIKVTLEMNKYRDILIYDLFKEITDKEDSIFDNIDEPLSFIETTLFAHIIEKKEL